MKRRTLLLASTSTALAALGGVAAVGLTLKVPAARTAPRVVTLAQAHTWVKGLSWAPPNAAMRNGWPLAAVLEHLAQSIEYSMVGFPQPKAAWFQHTVGAAAFATFKSQSRMTHGLSEPIPGGLPLQHLNATEGATMQQALASSSVWLRRAIEAFDAHRGPLQPHFAYGSLSKSDYATAHALHIDNHLDLLA